MKSRPAVAITLLLGFTLFSAFAAGSPAGSAADYSRHFDALSKLSVAVAEAMPPAQYAFRPDPSSMSFGS